MARAGASFGGSSARPGPLRFPLLAAALLAASCATWDFLADGKERAARLASENGWTYREFRGSRFLVAGFHSGLAGASEELAVYLEGDGVAWETRFLPSSDPTPARPLALRLAIQDPLPKAIYLGRPCQYVGAEAPPCRVEWWTSHRYAPAVVQSLSEAIDAAKALAGARTVHLVGYSGGGALAALLAAARRDVGSVITVGANLDHAGWTALHGDSALTGSLNAADVAEAVQSVPQVHFVGGKDTMVPPRLVQAYLARMSDRSSVLVRVVPAHDHECCWPETWPALVAEARAWIGRAGKR